MRKKISGFTLIEISFFIALTGLLFVAIIAGTQNSIWQQKYNDSVQNFARFVRSVYSEVVNTQGINGGRSDKAIYGKLISFGQRYDFNGAEIPSDMQKVFVYDVVGDVEDKNSGTSTISILLAALSANVLIEEKNNLGVVTGLKTAGIAESYSPIWGSVVESTKEKELFIGSILVARHPKSGMINTLVSNKVIEVNQVLNTNGNYDQAAKLLTDVLSLPEDNQNAFKVQEVDFCLNPYGVGQTGSLRRNIKIISNARNASGVEIVDLSNDPVINKCVK